MDFLSSSLCARDELFSGSTPPSPLLTSRTFPANAPTDAIAIHTNVHFSGAGSPLQASLKTSQSLGEAVKHVVQQLQLRGVAVPQAPILKVIGRAEYLDGPDTTFVGELPEVVLNRVFEIKDNRYFVMF